ncbi:MAG: hypothetical protein KAI71_03305 [Candidatus Pacebacteria bacterium]|nr:hypothetical protein [Candidatus Paceibacterota bacterium]
MAKKTGTLGPVGEETGKGSVFNQIYDLIGGKYLVITIVLVVSAAAIGMITMSLINNASTTGETTNPSGEGNLPDSNVPFGDDRAKEEKHEDGSIAQFNIFSTQKLNDETPDLIKSKFNNLYSTVSTDDFIVKVTIENHGTEKVPLGKVIVKYFMKVNGEITGIEHSHKISYGGTTTIYPGERIEITKDFREIQHLTILAPSWENNHNFVSIEATDIDL